MINEYKLIGVRMAVIRQQYMPRVKKPLTLRSSFLAKEYLVVIIANEDDSELFFQQELQFKLGHNHANNLSPLRHCTQSNVSARQAFAYRPHNAILEGLGDNL